ncbi:MAG: DUF4445 domain-containing protein [Clostridia bacterium]|nr:DUF4445 domain-containing protein [Clostridia bacterium]
MQLSYYIPNPIVTDRRATAYGVALDIGTTTLTAALVDLSDGALTAAVSALNSGRRYGADVLSRIAAANSGNAADLRLSLQQDADRLIRRLLTESDVSPDHVTRMAVAANTTMIHLLLGCDTSRLGIAPFTPTVLAPETKTYPQIFGNTTLSCNVMILPAASAFIGGDVIAGALTVDASPWLLVDLGTNGELLLFDGKRYWGTSAAAGPAFEGGGLSCGVGSIYGAICSVQMRGYTPRCRTIGGQTAVGLCGSGAVEALYELRKVGMIERDGTLHDRYADGVVLAEGVTLIQSDIRQLQLAVAAIRTAADLLLRQANVDPSQVQLRLAGGFGAQLNVTAAKGIGLLPETASASAVGNAALNGAAAVVTHPPLLNKAIAIAESVDVMQLANLPEFEGEYMGNIGW